MQHAQSRTKSLRTGKPKLQPRLPHARLGSAIDSRFGRHDAAATSTREDTTAKTRPMSALKAAGPSLKASVASLYRSFLREARRKDPNGARGTVEDIRRRFRTDAANVGRREFQRIEFMLREGHKKLKLMQMPGVTGVANRWGAKR